VPGPASRETQHHIQQAGRRVSEKNILSCNVILFVYIALQLDRWRSLQSESIMVLKQIFTS